MAKIKFTAALKRFFPNLEEVCVSGKTVAEVLQKTEEKYPGISDYLLDERGAVRQHMNIFVRGELIEDRITLQDKLGDDDEMVIFQALSGG
ncbi:MAG: MoaD/ThiS family protein [Bacteroidota bacterium]